VVVQEDLVGGTKLLRLSGQAVVHEVSRVGSGAKAELGDPQLLELVPVALHHGPELVHLVLELSAVVRIGLERGDVEVPPEAWNTVKVGEEPPPERPFCDDTGETRQDDRRAWVGAADDPSRL